MSIRNKIIKKLIALQMKGWSDGPIEEQRARQEKTSKYAVLPADIQCQPVEVDSIHAEWIYAPDVDFGVILYLHGRACALGSINVHREFIARLVKATKMRCLAINYRCPNLVRVRSVRMPYSGSVIESYILLIWMTRFLLLRNV